MHCSAGKDRTGVLVMLLLGVAGVEGERVCEEYALTEVGLEEEWKAEARRRLVGMGMDEMGIANMLEAR